MVMDQLSEEVRQESPWTMMFADDIVICSESREQVEENLERWRFALERRGMKVSGSKTEYMCVNEREGSGTVRLQGEEVKKVQEFKYLGSTVQSNGECGKEVKTSSERERKSRQTFHDLSSDSGEEYGVHKERIPTLQPVEEVEATYGPSSEHAAAIGIELRQRVRKAGELLHVLRDDIYEKVSIVYADRSEREQDSISVEVFTNTMGDAEIVQRLLEERPRTLVRAYEITHRQHRCQGKKGSTMELEETERHKLAELLSAYSDVFSTGPTDLGHTNLVQHDIQTQPGPPVKQPPRRMASGKQQSANEQIQQNLNAGLASPSNSSWASPIVMVQKKDQTYRLCVDYRVLNERTIKDAYPLPQIQDTLDTLSTVKWFSTLDLASGYWQVELTPGARQAATFCSRKGLFEWNVMPFGLCNAPAMFQRLMDRVLAGMQWEICLVYLDDIIVLGKDVKEMLQRLAQVFERLRQADLKLKPTKCCLFRRQVAYLGHIVSERGITTDPRKSAENSAVATAHKCYCQRFVKDFTTVAKPLHNLLRKHAQFHWTPECQLAFDKLKELLTTAPILGYPMDSGDLILDTDASNFGIGAVLSQLQRGGDMYWHMVVGV
ncbi:hypothetical protein QTP86_011083 [Hemibagrus guttatus]|nr:hypothetical protein QTP86_011083 [Hemibagrus guttatus]